MNRKERREIERELKKREVRLRKREENSGKKLHHRRAYSDEARNTGNHWKNNLAHERRASLARQAMLTAHPHVSVEPSSFAEPCGPVHNAIYREKRKLSLRGSRYSTVSVGRERLNTGHDTSVVSIGPLLITCSIQSPILNPGSSSTVDCPPVIGGLGAGTGVAFSMLNLEIVVSYRQTWWPLGTVTDRNAFAAKRDSQHGVHWVHITPAEEKPFFP